MGNGSDTTAGNQEQEPSQSAANISQDSLLRSGQDILQGEVFDGSVRHVDESLLNPTNSLVRTFRRSPPTSSPSQQHDPSLITLQYHQVLSQPEQRRKSFPESQPRKMSSADSAPGDTQVVSQSVFDSLIRQNRDAQNNNTGYRNLGYGDVAADGGTLVTLHEGDTGHIDLLSGFEHDAHPDSNHLEDNEENSSSKLGESSPLHFQPNLFPESQRFVTTTTTPATAVKQRNFEDLDLVTPLSRNPLPSDAGPSTGIMALSQVFKSTQAPSSPLVNGLQSDLMSDRPSPNIPIQNTSLPATFSSPSVSRPSTLWRKLSEPQAHYITMKESQAERDRIVGERMTRSAGDIHSDDQSDDEFDKEPSFVERLLRQRMIDQEAKAQLAGLTAPARLPSNRRGRRPRSLGTSPRTIVLDDVLGDPSAGLQNGGISEEETEQEEDLEPQIIVSQEPLASSEEDKENYNGPSLPALTGATSAHDRLSQALGLEESPSRGRQPTTEPTVFVQHSRHGGLIDQVDEPGTSSQIIVRDSQQSAGRKDDENGEGLELANIQWTRNTSQYHYPSLQPESSGLEKVASSPIPKPPMQSSPPSSKLQQSQTLLSSHPYGAATIDNRTTGTTGDRSASPSSHVSSTQLPKDAPAHDGMGSKSAASVNQVNQGATDIIDGISGLETREKSSSMPSHVAETPVHLHPLSFGGVTATTIPETSPRLHNRVWTGDWNGETLNQEEDDLPPTLPPDNDQANVSLPPSSRNLSPARTPYNPKILSSPSGRQRRALTEIAADASPQIGPSQFDVDVGILTAEDREFEALVGMSPAPPKKKRRGNYGQSVFASDPVMPVTPHSASPRLVSHVHAEPGEPQSTEAVNWAENSFRRHSKHPRSEETVWEVESSPQSNIPRTVQSKKRTQSGHEEQQPAQVRRPQEDKVSRPVTVHKNKDVAPVGGAESTDQGQGSIPIGDVPTKPQQSSDTVQIAPSQVLAPWSGNKRAYYPATCFGRPIGTSQLRYVVKFEDSIPVEVATGSVKRLELHVGDAVKVDMPNVPKITHIVRGFDDKLSAEELSKGMASGWVPMTDVYGHSTVILGPKQRKSLPSGGLIGPDSTIKVPISRIYLDTILWNQLKDRSFTASSEAAASENRSRVQTPSDRHSTPATSSTRSHSINYFRGIFTGMVFAVSYVENDNAKARITKLILENDGRVLREGFNELFEFPSSVRLANQMECDVMSSDGNLHLTTAAEEVRFACVIADKHSRREKYMQALALNLPCLSGRWIEDCVKENRILNWEMYLLPAGESMYLNGATKSRILAPNPAPTARLSDTITARPKLLEGKSVLLVMGRGKAEERRKAYIFLTYALGPSRVERVFDLKAAKALLDQQAADASSTPVWDLIYVDDSEQAAARNMLLGFSGTTGSEKTSSGRAGKKRKRSELMGSVHHNGGDADDSRKKMRIVGNEFICQSLILGKLFEA